MNHLRVAFHVPSGTLTQDDMDSALECVEKMALQQNKGDRPIFLILDNKVTRPEEFYSNDETMDFVIRLYGEPQKRI